MPHLEVIPGKFTFKKCFISVFKEDSILEDYKKDYKLKYLQFSPWNTDTSHLCLMSPN